MKFLLVTDGTWGDTLPFIFLAEKMKQEGHEPIIFSNIFYKEYVESKNIQFIATTSLADRDAFLSNPDLWHPQKGMRVIGTYAGVMFKQTYSKLEKHTDDNPIIVSHTFSYAAKTLAEKYKLRYASLLISPIQLRSTYRLPVFYGGKDVNKAPYFFKRLIYPLVDRFLIDPQFSTTINTERVALELSPISSFVHWATFNYPSICLWPDWYFQLQKDQQLAYCAGFPKKVEIDSQENTELHDWILSGSSPILVTMGSGYLFAKELLQILSHIAETAGERFIFVGPHTEENLSPQIKIFSHIKLSSVLPLCKLIVHHGGAGTLAQATVQGVPQLVMPMSHDQPDNAALIKQNKLGHVLWEHLPKPSKLIEAMHLVLSAHDIKNACEKAKKKCTDDPSGIESAYNFLMKKFAK